MRNLTLALTFVSTSALLTSCGGGSPVGNSSFGPAGNIASDISSGVGKAVIVGPIEAAEYVGKKAGKEFRNVGKEFEDFVKDLIPCDDYLSEAFGGGSILDENSITSCFIESTPLSLVVKQKCKWYVEKTLDGTEVDQEMREECNIVLVTE